MGSLHPRDGGSRKRPTGTQRGPGGAAQPLEEDEQGEGRESGGKEDQGAGELLHAMKPRSGVGNRLRLGKTVLISEDGTPNHFARVAEC